MSHLNILLPSSIPPAEMANDLLRELKLPHLAALLVESTRTQSETFADFSPALPHEFWLARERGAIAALRHDSSPPVAAEAARRAALLQSPDESWFVLQPSHFHIARDHLVLTDVRQLAISDNEARSLFDTAAPAFDEAGFALHYLDPRQWLVRANDWRGLKTTTPDAACGHNIDLWLPKGPGERAWRRVHNEIQMLWHVHPVNAAREARGDRPVNALWLWGGSDAAPAGQLDALHLFGPTDALEQILTARGEPATLVLDALLEPALADDWGQWLSAFSLLDEQWFKPVGAALKEGRLASVDLVTTGDRALTTWRVRRSLLKRLLRRPSLSVLVQA